MKSNNFSHGLEGTKTYDCWVNMKQRCLNPKSSAYQHYGGRGIKVCEQWLSFSAFLKDMGKMPLSHSIERKDANGNYEPGNCLWIPRKQQSMNLRKSVFVTIDGVTRHLKEWSDDLGLRYATVFQRITRDGMSPKDALSKPITRSRKGVKHRKASNE